MLRCSMPEQDEIQKQIYAIVSQYDGFKLGGLQQLIEVAKGRGATPEDILRLLTMPMPDLDMDV